MRSARGDIRVGISGWRYEPWRGVFYPKGLPQRRELEFASRMLPTIEINGSFYSLQHPDYYAGWREETPDDFVFAVKAPKYITHERRLKDVQAPLANFLANGLFELRGKLGPILWQFPPMLPFKPDRFEAFFEMLPHDTAAAARMAEHHDERVQDRVSLTIDRKRPMRHAVEIRHPSFADPAFIGLVVERDGEVVGDSMLHLQGTGLSEAEIGWTVLPQHLGHGYATEAAREVLRLAFEHYGVRRVVANLDARNDRSAALCDRLGMRRESHRVADFWSKGRWTDSLEYAVLRDEWLAARG